MGLDIYLYEYTMSIAELEKLDEQREKISDNIWKEEGVSFSVDEEGEIAYNDLTSEQKDVIRDKIKKEQAKLKNPDDYRHHIEMPSAKHPEHLFKMGYFRSSYNNAGINTILSDRLDGRDLYWIFQTEGEEYHFIPDWEESLKRAKQLLKDFNEVLAAPGGQCSVIEVDRNPFLPDHEADIAEKPADALRMYKEQLRPPVEGAPPGIDFSSYSNRFGHFFTGDSPPKLRGLIFGKTMMFGERPACYAIVEYGNGFDFYKEALEIVIETCEFVLEQAKEGKFFALHWSG